MKKALKHAELIKAWADGAEIEFFDGVCHAWLDCPSRPAWDEDTSYRIKLKDTRDFVLTAAAAMVTSSGTFDPVVAFVYGKAHNLKLTFDRDTHEIKAAEVLK